MATAIRGIRVSFVALVAAVGIGCAEAKVGVGPFKAMSIEVGPGGAEAKGPGAGPLNAGGVEKD